MLIDRTPPLGRMQKLAGALEDRVLSMTQHTAIPLDHFGKPLFGAFVAQRKASCEALNVTPRDDDVFV